MENCFEEEEFDMCPADEKNCLHDPKIQRQLDMILEDLVKESERDSQGRVILDFHEVDKRTDAILGKNGSLQKLINKVINTK